MEPTERQLMWAVQALAQPADVQPTLFPSFAAVADELALEFDHRRQVAQWQFGTAWSPARCSAIEILGQLLSGMSGPGRPELWLDEGCIRHPQWSEVRRLAGAVLEAFRWQQDRPPVDRGGIYIGPPGT